ncbi:MAG: carboxypeptidase-like regulatory domain-containing protein, partial [Paludibacter sp.]|nr:carboxypeptidase-like regulatory domain-containing protein [Paludibacter sp.]
MNLKKKHYYFTHLLLSFILILISSNVVSQTSTVSGLVTSSEDGEPLIGVNVMVKGTTTGTITNLDGVFKIEAKPENQILVFSMVGMKTIEVNVRNRTAVNVAMEFDTKMLEQVVVTGYTTQKKADLTGAVSVVNIGEIMKQSENNPIKSLQGRIPGVNVSSDGNPSGAATVRIRGIGTLNSNDPLYIIDGVPTKSGMHELNSADIESIQVLR